MKDERVKDAAQDLAFGARAARALLGAPRHATTAAVFVQLALRWRWGRGRNWAAQLHLARAVG